MAPSGHINFMKDGSVTPVQSSGSGDTTSLERPTLSSPTAHAGDTDNQLGRVVSQDLPNNENDLKRGIKSGDAW